MNENLLNLCNHDCKACPLSEIRPTQVVNGVGPLDARIMFVGDAPGSEEDRLGLPFVGRAGRKLNGLLARVDLHKSQVFMTHATRCFPSLRTEEGFRAPSWEEM